MVISVQKDFSIANFGRQTGDIQLNSTQQATQKVAHKRKKLNELNRVLDSLNNSQDAF